MTRAAPSVDMMTKLINRFYRTTAGLFAAQADRDWLNDGRIDGTISIENTEIARLPITVIDTWKDSLSSGTNRAQRRAAARKRA